MGVAVTPGEVVEVKLDMLRQQHRRDEAELGRRAVLPIRTENTGTVRARERVIRDRWPFRWWQVETPAGPVTVQTEQGWPGHWRDSSIGRYPAVELP